MSTGGLSKILIVDFQILLDFSGWDNVNRTSIIHLCSTNGTRIIYIVGIVRFGKCHEIGDLNFGRQIHLFYITRLVHTLLNTTIHLRRTSIDSLPRYEVPLCGVSAPIIQAWNMISPSFRHASPTEYLTYTTNAIYILSVENPVPM